MGDRSLEGKKGKTLGCLSFSLLFHGACVVAIAMTATSYTGGLTSSGANEDKKSTGFVEIDTSEALSAANTTTVAKPAPIIENSATPDEVVVAPKAATEDKKAAPSPIVKKNTVKESPATELPAKKTVSEPAEEVDPNLKAVAVVDDPAATEAKVPEENTDVEPREAQLADEALAAAGSGNANTKTETGAEDAQVESAGVDRAEDTKSDTATGVVAAQEVAAETGAEATEPQKEELPAPVVAAAAPTTTTTESVKKDEPASTAQKSEVAAANTTTAPAAQQPATTVIATSKGPTEGSATAQGTGAIQDARNLVQMPGNNPPEYPTQDRLQGNQGIVYLTYFVNANGTVSNIRVARSSGHPRLDAEAVRAVSKYRYVPGQDGPAVHPVIFKLNGPQQEMQSGLRRSADSGM